MSDKAVSPGIAINGTKLEEVQMRMRPDRTGACHRMNFPKSRIKFSPTGDTLVLTLPPQLGMELYRSGVLLQDPQAPVAIKIGGCHWGRFVIVEVRYPDHGSEDVEFTIRRCAKGAARER